VGVTATYTRKEDTPHVSNTRRAQSREAVSGRARELDQPHSHSTLGPHSSPQSSAPHSSRVVPSLVPHNAQESPPDPQTGTAAWGAGGKMFVLKMKLASGPFVEKSGITLKTTTLLMPQDLVITVFRTLRELLLPMTSWRPLMCSKKPKL